MKNEKLKGALKQVNALKQSDKAEIEILDTKKARLIKGGTAPISQSPVSDSCGKVFSCGVYHVV